MKRPLIASPPWTPTEDQHLRDLVLSSKSTADVAKQIGRSEQAIRNRLFKLGIPFKRIKLVLKAEGK
jgi:hypothetical protein